MRNRAAAVIVQERRVVLIKRIWEGCTYYVFPGGGIEEGEAPEQAAEREAFEELGVTVQVTRLMAAIDYDGRQYFFAADILAGTVGSGSGAEFTDSKRDRGTYEPMWIPIDQVSYLDIRPKEIAIVFTAGGS